MTSIVILHWWQGSDQKLKRFPSRIDRSGNHYGNLRQPYLCHRTFWYSQTAARKHQFNFRTGLSGMCDILPRCRYSSLFSRASLIRSLPLSAICCRVPGTDGDSFQKKRAAGADVRIVASANECIELAQFYPQKEVIMMGIGFETTAPTIAATVETCRKKGIENFSVFSVHKIVPPALRSLTCRSPAEH